MSHEIVIRGGEIVDGTGAGPVRADLAIDDGLISAVGEVSGRGQREVDAEGHIVSPGFVDLHTHLDAQIGWDPFLTPLSWHGVTTALLGNCGVTFAPCKPSDRELLASMMETVEDIPKHAILTGLPWTWEDYGGYLDALDKLQPSINVAGLVGHCAVRYYAMGDRAVDQQATPAELKQMCEVVASAMDRGAFGFSTSRYEPHRLPDGRSIPGTFASPAELTEIGEAVRARNGLMQLVGASNDVLENLARQNRVLFSCGVNIAWGATGSSQTERLRQLNTYGEVTAVTQIRGSGYLLGLQAALPFQGETWDRLRDTDLPGRLIAIHDADTAAKLVEEGKRSTYWFELDHLYFLGDSEIPDYAAPIQHSVVKLCDDSREHFVELFLRLSRLTKGKGWFNLRLFNRDLEELAVLLRSKHVFPGLGDAGAHVSQIMDAGWSTFVLSYWVRQRQQYTLGEGVRRLTSGPARVLGLEDRGVLAVGKRADVNVFDLNGITELQPELVHDLPGGAPRLIQRARGYKATLVNGVFNVIDDRPTGLRAGKVLRHRPVNV